MCPKDHLFSVTFSNFKNRNSRCPECERVAISKRCKTPYEKILKTALERNLTLLTSEKEYEVNAQKNRKITLKCCCEYVYTVRVTEFNTGKGCIKCGFKKTGDKKRKTYEEVKKSVEKAGYKLLSTEYKDNKQKLSLVCDKHGIFVSMLNSILMGHGCRKCYCKGEKVQKEISDFIKNLNFDCIENNRETIKPFELDFLIPEINLAIEYCGLRWHSEQYKEDKNYHFNKMKMCNGKDIRLITIFEDEWLNRKDQVKNFLASVFNKNTTKIMARKTELKTVSKKDASAFLENNHIQGSCLFEIAFGLYHENELVAIITGNKHHRQGHGSKFVLNRLAFKNDVSVTGGSSKLLKALLSYAKQNGYSSLISWSDNRWSEGNVYEKLGFELTEELPPDYSYVHKERRISKQSCQKKNLIKKGAIGTMENNEQELALSLGLYRIYDCGKKRWVMDLSSK